MTLLRLLVVVLTAALVLSNAPPAAAQADVASATLAGVVRDGTGGALPGATVTVESVERGTLRSTVTDATGGYRVLLLEPGVYDMRIELSGFSTRLFRGIALAIGQIAVYDAELAIGAVTESVEVVASTPLAEPRRTQQASTINSVQIDAQPNVGRLFSTYVVTQPGITEADAPRSQNPGFVWPTAGFSIGGNNGRNNLITVDGGEHEYGSGTIRHPLNVAAIQEFQVNRNGYAAEFGFTAGTAVNVITKSGTNQVRGEAYTYFRSSGMAARNYFDPGTEPAHNQFVTPGGTVGGPLRRNRLFAFGAFEALRAEQARFHPFLENLEVYGPTATPLAPVGLREQERYLQRLAAAADPNIRRIGAVLRQTLTTTNYASTMRMLQEASGSVTARDGREHYMGRLDFHGDRNLLTVRFTAFNAQTDSSFVAPSPTTAGTAGSDIGLLDRTVLGTWSRSIGASMMHQARVQMALSDAPILPKSEAPTFQIAGVGTFGRNGRLPIDVDQRRLQFEETLTVVRNRHAMKFGASYRPIKYNVRAELFFAGQWTFASGVYPLLLAVPPADQGALALFNTTTIDPATGRPFGATGPPGAALTGLQNFNLGLPLVMYQGFNNPVWEDWAHYLGVFAQDSWQASDRVTLDYGLRFDREAEPTPLTAHSFVSPRLGVAWDLTGDRRTVVRASGGLFYAPIFFQVPQLGALLNDSGRYINQILLTPASPQSPIALWQAGRAMGRLPDRPLTESDLRALGVPIGRGAPGRVIFDVDPEYTNPYTIQASAGVTHQLRPDLAIDVAFLTYRGRDLGLSREMNYRETGVVHPLLGPRYAPIDPTIIQRNVAQSIGRSTYNGITAAVTKRFSRSHQFQLNYTLGHAQDNVTDLDSTFSAFMPTRLDREWADSTFDIRHNFNATAVLMVPPGTGGNVLGQLFGDLAVSPVFALRSGLPFTLRVGRDVNGDTHDLYDRPFLADRNTGRGAAYASLDVRVTKQVPLGPGGIRAALLVEASNVLNRTNFLAVNDVVGEDPKYLEGPFDRRGSRAVSPTVPLGFSVAAPGRQLQVGVRILF